MAKREKVSCGRVLAWACVASASRSLELLPRKVALKFNFRCLKLHRAIVMLNTAPPPPSPHPEGRVTSLCGLYWGLPLDRIRFLVSVPKHGIKFYARLPQPGMVSTIDIPFRFSVLNRARVSNPQRHPYTQTLVKIKINKYTLFQ